MKQDENQSELARVQLREAGLRATAARIAILNLLGELANPSTHSEISERVQPLGFDKSTIFRTLNDLATAGLARRMELGDHETDGLKHCRICKSAKARERWVLIYGGSKRKTWLEPTVS